MRVGKWRRVRREVGRVSSSCADGGRLRSCADGEGLRVAEGDELACGCERAGRSFGCALRASLRMTGSCGVDAGLRWRR